MALHGFGLAVSHSPGVEQNKGKANNRDELKNLCEDIKEVEKGTLKEDTQLNLSTIHWASHPSEKLSKIELEAATSQHFLDSVRINEEGRIKVRLPFIENHSPLSTNYGLAMKRMNDTIKKLKSEGYYEAYRLVLNDWINEGIIEGVTEEFGDVLPLPAAPTCNKIRKFNTDTPSFRCFDACLTSYGSVAFLRVAFREGARLQLVSAKARVAAIKKPSKSLTIPRLELLAASISGRLYKSHGLEDVKLVYNRVRKIREWSGQEWCHVPGTINPADLVSQGSYPKIRWWEGPIWLKRSEKTWSQPEFTYNNEINKMRVLLLVQKEVFDDVFDKRLKTLLPFTDENGLMRINDFCYLIISPNHEHLAVFRLILDWHRDNSHTGVQMMTSILRCKRHNVKRSESVPTPLPEAQVRDAKIFEVTGVNLVYASVCLFMCAIYRAAHIELILSLSTDSFLKGLKQFVSRRDRPAIIYGDQGSNFIGFGNACKELHWSIIQQYSSARRIDWRFNPPASPWWGGWFERLIGVLKALLRPVLGRSLVTYKEMATILCDCESLINNHPITHLSQDSSDLALLTPCLFLQEVEKIGVSEISTLRERFRTEYLGQIKLFSTKGSPKELSVEKIVLIANYDSKRIDWPLARIIETIKGKDGYVRVVKLKTAAEELTRPVQRVYPLELETNSDGVSKAVGEGLRESVKEDVTLDSCPGTSDPDEDEEKPVKSSELHEKKTRSRRIVQEPKKYLQ
ncbi:hypothetical protein ILUMI_12809 [Ignelater luminosus]|uniref:Integrase catalytic domain-containing protein n=1 Tax=Ignelater luminosus TaxID=2038154 RepID=A0A8K0GCL1_IGNLU|nr:hypothetical protein ILUMI_12809 [Ignelater luminosus]